MRLLEECLVEFELLDLVGRSPGNRANHYERLRSHDLRRRFGAIGRIRLDVLHNGSHLRNRRGQRVSDLLPTRTNVVGLGVSGDRLDSAVRDGAGFVDTPVQVPPCHALDIAAMMPW